MKQLLQILSMLVLFTSVVIAQPTIVNITPAQNDQSVSNSSQISIQFSGAMNTSTINANTVVVYGSVRGIYSGTFNIPVNFAAIFNPNSSFLPGEIITVVITSGVKDNSNTAMASPYIWSFTASIAEGNGIFETDANYTTGDSPEDVVLADFDNDGFTDIAVGNTSDATISVFINNGDATYAAAVNYASGGTTLRGLAAGDVDGDGYVDLVATNNLISGNANIKVLTNDGDGTFTSDGDYGHDSYLPGYIKLADIDGDGDLDIVIIYEIDDGLGRMFNNGSGVFSSLGIYSAGNQPQNVQVGDVDGDNDLDMVVTNMNSDNISIMENIGSGTFSATSKSVGDSPRASVLGDFDDDGDLDIATVNHNDNNISVYLNQDAGSINFSFTFPTNYSVGSFPFGIASADVDADGDLDLLTTNSGEDSLSVLTNNGSGIFSLLGKFATGDSPKGIAIGDFDNNDNVNIVVTNQIDDNISIIKTAKAPTITAVSNRNGTNISASANLTATFSGSLDASSVNDTSVFVYGSKTGAVDGSLSYDDPSKTITFNPTNNFIAGEKVTMSLTTKLKSDLGVNFLGYNFSYIVAGTGNGNTIFGDTLLASTSLSISKFTAADIDNDGDEDLITRNNNGFVFYKNNAGTYSESSTLAFNTVDRIFPGDIDNDGDIDILFQYQGTNKVVTAENDGSGSYSLRDTTTVSSMNIGLVFEDFDGDGNLDFYYRFGATINSINWGKGDYTFSTTSSTSPDFSFDLLTSGDIDNDGDIDVLGFNGNNSKMQVMVNNGDRSFDAGGTYSGITSSTFVYAYYPSTADVNGDGYLDVIVPSSTGFQILINDGDGTFASPVTYLTGNYDLQSVQVFDYDGDGNLDLSFYADNDPEGTNHLFFAYNDGTGGFGNQDLFEFNDGAPDYFSGFSNDYAVTDFDGDGDLDIAVNLSKSGATTRYYLAFAENATGVSGVAPTTAASGISFSAITAMSAKVQWSNGDGSRRLIVVKEGSAVDATPVDDSGYQPNPSFGSGTELGTGNYAVYGGPANEMIVSGLSAETEYFVQIFELNGLPGAEKFYTTSAPVGNFTTSPPPTIWSKNDSTMVFTKADYADFALEANQDRITENLWLTREDKKGIFNILDEFEYNSNVSPSGTMWALGTTDNLSSLTFDTWANIHDGSPPDLVGEDMVVYIELDDLYLDINFSSWTENAEGGGFSYTRAKGPAPVTMTQTFQDSAGYALRFDNDNSYERYLEVYDNSFNIGSEFTIETWVKLDSLGIEQGIISLYSEVGIGITSTNTVYAYHNQPEAASGGGGGGEEGPCCEEFSAPTTYEKSELTPVITEFAGPSGTVSLESTDALAKDEWYHIALTGESGGFLKLYINGVVQDSDSVQNVGVDENYWYFGRERDRGVYMYGLMDEVRIWKADRTESQIRSYMHRPYGGDIARLYGYWQFNEGTGTSTFDGLSNREAEFYNGNISAWFSSDAPIGDGTVEETSDFQNGTTNVGNATLSMADGFDNPVDVQVTEVSGEPNQFPAGFTSGLGGKYFVINLFGDPGTFSVDLTLTYGPNVISAAQQSNPNLVKLYKRGSNSTGAWTEIASASSANATTGVVTWTGITSFSQFMAVATEPTFNIQIADGFDLVSYNDSTFTFADSLFDLEDGFADSLLTINSKSTLIGSLYLDQNANGVYDDGTDSLLTANKELSYTPSGSIKLRYSSSAPGVESATIKLQHSVGVDSVLLDFATVEGDPSIVGNNGENGWYLLSNPLSTTIGELLSTVWTQGAINSKAPNGDATLYTFSQDSSKYVAVTTDIDTTHLSAGQGLLVYLFEDDDVDDGQSDVDGGWPKVFSNYGNPFGSDVSITVKNVNHDGVEGTSGSEGFALFGNPYGWALSVDSVISTLKEEDPLANSYVYRWNAVEKTYQILSTGSINAYESVFVRVIGSGTTANLNFSYEDGVGVLSKKQEPKMFELDLVHTESGVSSKFRLRNGNDANMGIDPYDGYYLGSYAKSYSNLYSIVENQPLSINNIPLGFNGELEIPLFIDATISEDFELNWDPKAIPEEWTIVLENNSTGEQIAMNEVNSYLLNVESYEKPVTNTSNRLFSIANHSEKNKANSVPILSLKITSSLVVGTENELDIPNIVELNQNYPNPFNPSSVINFGIPSQSKVRLEVFDILGRKVATLINDEVKAAGRYNITFMGDNLASGMYLYRLSVGNKVIVKKMTLIK